MPKISEENRSSESARKSVLDRGRWSWTSGTVGAVAAGAFGTALAVFAWGGDGDAAEATLTRVQLHAAALRAEGEAGAETSDAWLAAGRRALVAPASVSPPFRDTARLPTDELAAAAYRFPLLEGQAVEVTLEIPSGASYFLDLYRVVGDDPEGTVLEVESDSAGAPFRHEVRVDGDYVLRVLPRPFEGGPYVLELSTRPAFPFPVAERGPRSIISRYGAPRDGGARSHEGVDIIAPAGTPVLAVSNALVYDVGTSPRGGNYVWLQDWDRRKEIYYAHLEESWVRVGMVVEPGDEIGSVGNTGNAENTAPHLHFGVYDLDRRPSDPLPYVAPPVLE